jgi:transcription elongation GreA/GreB family factor
MSRAFVKDGDDLPEVRVVPRQAEPPPEPPSDHTVIGFGARVRVDSVGVPESTFTIVADDAADVASGKIGVSSPLAVALMGKRKGERAVWQRPVGDRHLRIRSVEYEDSPT